MSPRSSAQILTSKEKTVSLTQLFSYAEFLIDAQRTASPGVYVLYASGKQLCIDRDRPRTTQYEVVCRVNSALIKSGLPRIWWRSLYGELRRFKKKGLL